MSETTTQTQVKLPEPSAIIRGVHYLQLTIAVGILCLDVYGVHFIPYNAIVCSCIAAICTIPVCIYLIMALSCLHKLYSPYIAGTYHLWMLIFWIIDLALVAQLAKLWSDPECTYDLRNHYMCAPYQRRQVMGSRITPFSTFYGALVAGAVLAAFELALWTLTASFHFLHWRKSRLAFHPPTYDSYMYPPQTTAHPPIASIPFQDLSGTAYAQVFRVPAPQDPWDLPFTPPGVVRGPILPDTRTSVGTDASRPAMDAVSELTFGSPVSSSSEGAVTSIRGFVDRDILPAYPRPAARGETSGPPTDTQQKDWSGGSNLQRTGPGAISTRTAASAKTSMSEGRVRRFTMDDMPYEV